MSEGRRRTGTVIRLASVVSGSYQRNNKSGGRKNLRCFPSCHDIGHRRSGFCGGNLVAHVRYGDEGVEGEEIDHSQYWVVGVFEVKTDKPSIAMKSTTKISHAEALLKNDTNKTGSWYRAVLKDANMRGVDGTFRGSS